MALLQSQHIKLLTFKPTRGADVSGFGTFSLDVWLLTLDKLSLDMFKDSIEIQ